MVECLSSTHKALDSIRSAAKTKNPFSLAFYLVGACWDAAATRLQGGEEGLPLQTQQPALGSHWSESL